MQIGRKKSNEFELDTKVIKICFWTKFELVHESWKFRKMIIAYQFLHLLPQHLIIEICESNNNTNFWKLFSLPNKFPLGWRFQWYIIHAYSMYEKGLLEVKTDQKRTILAKKSVFRTSGGKPDQSISSVVLWNSTDRLLRCEMGWQKGKGSWQKEIQVNRKKYSETPPLYYYKFPYKRL